MSGTDGKYDMKVKISLSKGTYTQTELNKIKGYRLFILTKKGDVYSTQTASFTYDSRAESPYVLVTKPMTPGATFGVLVCLYSDETCETLADISDYSNAQFTAPATYNISTDKNAPVSISLGNSVKEIKGPQMCREIMFITHLL